MADVKWIMGIIIHIMLHNILEKGMGSVSVKATDEEGVLC